MRIYLLSPEGVPMNQVLFPTMIKTFEERGNVFVNGIDNCDTVFFDLHSRLSDYQQSDIDFVLQSNVPIVTFDEWDRGNMSSDEWPHPLTDQQYQIFATIQNSRFVHFCRLLDKTKKQLPNLFPYEKPILYEETILSSSELFERPYDVVFLANTSPSREAIGQALLNDKRLKCHVSLGAQKIPFNIFVEWHKRGKLFVSSGAGGFTDERCQNLFSVAGIIRERSNQLLANDFIHLENCLRIDNPPSKQDLDTLYQIVNDKERLYEIYMNGYRFMKTHYSEEAMSNYILDTIQKHL